MFRQAVNPLVNQVFEGVNATVLAYGQTGTGKTYTLGTGVAKTVLKDKNRGIIQRFLEQLFDKLQKLSATRKFIMTASFLEIYNEKLKDLADANPQTQSKCSSNKRKQRRLTIMTGQKGDAVKINGVTTVRLEGVAQVPFSLNGRHIYSNFLSNDDVCYVMLLQCIHY